MKRVCVTYSLIPYQGKPMDGKPELGTGDSMIENEVLKNEFCDETGILWKIENGRELKKMKEKSKFDGSE